MLLSKVVNLLSAKTYLAGNREQNGHNNLLMEWSDLLIN